MPSQWPRRGLYAITPDEADTQELLWRAEVVLDQREDVSVVVDNEQMGL